MFFQTINRMITAGTDLSINIRQVNDKLTVAVMPRRAGLKDEAGEQIVPLVLNGTPEELDMEFLGAITAPVQKAQGILTNLETFEKQAEQAVSQSKAAKSVAEKESKEVREKREKMEKLLKKAEDATGGKRYSEALTWLRQAKRLAMPDKQKEIDVKISGGTEKSVRGQSLRSGTGNAGTTARAGYPTGGAATGTRSCPPISGRGTDTDVRTRTTVPPISPPDSAVGTRHATTTGSTRTGGFTTRSGWYTGRLSAAREPTADHTIPPAGTDAAITGIRRSMAATRPFATANGFHANRSR
jgi:PRTRC genetic system protein E